MTFRTAVYFLLAALGLLAASWSGPPGVWLGPGQQAVMVAPAPVVTAMQVAMGIQPGAASASGVERRIGEAA
jgi:hypothetical protein